MTLFLASLPLWLSGLLIVGLTTGLSMLGPILVRRRVALERLATNNEIAGFKFATVGVIYAVMLAFAVIVVWEKFSAAESAVVQEAGAAATLYRLSGALEPDARRGFEESLTGYLKAAVEQDWPAMEQCKLSPAVTQALNAVYTELITLSKGATLQQVTIQQAVLTEFWRQLDAMTQARRTRLELANGIVPSVIWLVLASGAILTVSFTFFFGTRNLAAQVAMTGVLAFLIFMGLLVILAINYPFTGTVKVGSEPLELVLDDFHPRS